MVEELLNSRRDDREHIIIEIEVNDVLQAEPLGVVEATALLLDNRLKG